MMNGIFEGAIADAKKYAEAAAKDLLDAALAQGQMEAIKDFAGPLASRVFFKVMGVPELGQRAVDQWVRTALDAHRKTMPDLERLRGGSAQLAMQTYFLGLVNAPADPDTIPNSILAGMRQRTGCPAAKDVLQYDESMNTALHMALGGYLSTQFLIGSGVYNLLRHPQQWHLLRADRSLMPQAIDEMLRYDAPFQLADRWVKKGTQLGDKTFDQDTVLAVVYGSANRDRSVFPDDADRFSIERKLRKGAGDWTPNLGFGYGIHRCIGEGLARTVTAVALNALLDRCPTARIGEVGSWAPDPYFRSLTKLQLLLR
jgi:cytochrome P450